MRTLTCLLLLSMAAMLAAAQTAPPRKVLVAIVLAEGATVIDFAGPFEVFDDTMIRPDGKPFDMAKDKMDDMVHPFEVYTVASKKELIETSGGMQIMPKYTFADAPTPDVVLVPAESRNSPGREEWLKKVNEKTKMTVSVCTGAFILAHAGLLDGLNATTHHNYQDDFEKMFPKVKLQKTVRYVDNGHLLTAGGLSSGIDLALHIVSRYYGDDVAAMTAFYMEYQGEGWRKPQVAVASAK